MNEDLRSPCRPLLKNSLIFECGVPEETSQLARLKSYPEVNGVHGFMLSGSGTGRAASPKHCPAPGNVSVSNVTGGISYRPS